MCYYVSPSGHLEVGDWKEGRILFWFVWMSSFGFGDDDDDDGVFDTQFNFPQEAKCLTQVSDVEESQV